MELKNETKQIVRSIKMLEGVYKSSPDARQRARVKKDLDNLRKRLQELYPTMM
jgi:Holliday junction resolvase RusA-like endonuclease